MSEGQTTEIVPHADACLRVTSSSAAACSCGADRAAQISDALEAARAEAAAYRTARRRLRLLHTSLAGQRQDWANSTTSCASARAVAYQSAMSSVHSIIDEIEAIAGGRDE
jgi:hypothetical protein